MASSRGRPPFLTMRRLRVVVTAPNTVFWSRRGRAARAIEDWPLTSLQQRLVKTCGRSVKHARRYRLIQAESHLTRRLFAGVLGRIAALLSPEG
jgi:hypothetical protein